jgi:hypothetical protein
VSACGIRTYSAWVPSISFPRIQPPVLQCEYIPFLQNSHVPHAVMQEIRTEAPLWKFETAFPTSSTTPTPSCPRIRPSVAVGTSPLRMWRSLPQIVEVVIRTMASVASLTIGLGLSSQARRPGPWKTRAFMVVFWVPLPAFFIRACDLLIASCLLSHGAAASSWTFPQQRCRMTLVMDGKHAEPLPPPLTHARRPFR